MPDDLRARIISLVVKVLMPEVRITQSICATQKLSELGVDSLKMVNLMLAVETEFDIDVPRSEITPENFYSVVSLEALVGRLKGI